MFFSFGAKRQRIKRRSALALAIAVVLLGPVSASFSTTGSFQGLGDLADGSVWSIAYDISADGSTVVGDSYSASGREAFRWTQGSGLYGLGLIPVENAYSSASSVSGDGGYVTGDIRTQNYAGEAFLWSEPNGFLFLGALVEPLDSHWSEATGVSDDGSIVVGTSLTDDPTPAQVAFRWTAIDGMQALGDLPGGDYRSSANGVSSDGTVVVGHSRSAFGGEAFRWSESGGMEPLGDLPGGAFASYAYAASADGSVVVGTSHSEHSWREAFRWTQAEGMKGLGDLPGGEFYSIANAVSGDGSVVVGLSESSLSGNYEDDAFVWDEYYGMRSIREVLRREGIDMTGWTLYGATGISEDGLKVVGYGENPDGNGEAWIATLPAPASIERVGPEWITTYNGSANMADWATTIAVDERGCVYTGGTSYKAFLDSDYLTVKYDANGTILWSARYVGPVASVNGISDLVIDKFGNVYVTGDINAGEYGACVTIKYDSNGNELWAAKYDKGPDMSAVAYAIALDPHCNAYIAGRVMVNTKYKCLTIKYDPNGNEKWASIYDIASAHRSVGHTVATDNYGDVCVTGCTYMPGGVESFYMTVKYDANGTELWAAEYGQEDSDASAWDIALDESGNAYVTGESLDRAGSDTLDVATIKYGVDGNEIWVSRYSSGWLARGRQIALDAQGNVYVGGNLGRPYDDSGDQLVLKYDPNGNEMWAESYNGPADHADLLLDMAVDAPGNVYVTGYSSNGSDRDYITIKYNTDGWKSWVQNYDGPANGDDGAGGIAVDGDGNIYVTGGSEGSGSEIECATIKYSKCTQTGDIDCDRDVDFGDFAVLAHNWLDINCGKCGWADLTDDANVGMDDLLVLTENWLAGITP